MNKDDVTRNCTRLGPEGLKWIFGKCYNLVLSYNDKREWTDEEWVKLSEEVKKIGKNSREHRLCVDIVLAVLNYLQSVNKEQPKENA